MGIKSFSNQFEKEKRKEKCMQKCAYCGSYLCLKISGNQVCLSDASWQGKKWCEGTIKILKAYKQEKEGK